MEQQDMLQLQTNSIGVYGWRKRCLYLFVLLLVVMVVVNLGLTVWILVVLNFNIHGMGSLRITDMGLRLEGRAEFVEPLYAQAITADQGVPIVMQSDIGVNINAGSSQLNIEPDSITILSDSFEVHSQDQSGNQPLFSVSRDGVSVATHVLDAGGPLGASFDGPVEASLVTSHPDSALRLEPPSGQLETMATEGITLQTGFTGNIDIKSYDNLMLKSQKIDVSGRSLLLPNLPVFTPPSATGGSTDPALNVKSMVCTCASGQVYLVASYSTNGCSGDGGFCSQ